MALRQLVGYFTDAFSQLMAPKVCRVCGQALIADEQVLCLSCLMALPRTNVHHSDFNEIHRRLGHHVKVDRAAGWFDYRRTTPYAQLLVDAKYSGLGAIDYYLGRIFANELKGDGFFEGIEAIVPMPMYWIKKLKRGYNQAYEISRGISDVTSIPITEALTAVKSHGTQSRNKKAQRFSGIAGTMGVPNVTLIQGKNILLVDDIITSGASCIEALRALSKAQPSSINVLCLGLTSLNN